jgi:3-hydroxyacyl-CoA dehydrogenase
MKIIGVIGAGIMGAGIAQVAAENGYTVKIYDVAASMMDKAVKTMQKNWQKAVEKGKSTQEDMDKQVAAVTCVNSVDELNDVDLVIEAVAENMELKNPYWLNSIKSAEKNDIGHQYLHPSGHGNCRRNEQA